MFTEINRQTAWITICDGRGVYAKNINLHIRLKESNILWLDVDVECAGAFVPSRLDDARIYHSGEKTPDSVTVTYVWHKDTAFNSHLGYRSMMWFALVCSIALVIGIVVVSSMQVQEVIRNQQFKQPVKSQKTDCPVCFRAVYPMHSKRRKERGALFQREKRESASVTKRVEQCSRSIVESKR